MKLSRGAWLTFFSLLCYGAFPGTGNADQTVRLSQLDRFWNEVQEAVQNGDYERYRSTCHPSGVLVSGLSKTSYPLSKALDGWKQGFLDTKSGKMKAGVEFRFSQRVGDEVTAHETGIFHYWTVDGNGNRNDKFVHFEALLVKEHGWQTLMEYQKSLATVAEWARLK